LTPLKERNLSGKGLFWLKQKWEVMSDEWEVKM
jgi:hypothetical protein